MLIGIDLVVEYNELPKDSFIASFALGPFLQSWMELHDANEKRCGSFHVYNDNTLSNYEGESQNLDIIVYEKRTHRALYYAGEIVHFATPMSSSHYAVRANLLLPFKLKYVCFLKLPLCHIEGVATFIGSSLNVNIGFYNFDEMMSVCAGQRIMQSYRKIAVTGRIVDTIISYRTSDLNTTEFESAKLTDASQEVIQHTKASAIVHKIEKHPSRDFEIMDRNEEEIKPRMINFSELLVNLTQIRPDSPVKPETDIVCSDDEGDDELMAEITTLCNRKSHNLILCGKCDFGVSHQSLRNNSVIPLPDSEKVELSCAESQPERRPFKNQHRSGKQRVAVGYPPIDGSYTRKQKTHFSMETLASAAKRPSHIRNIRSTTSPTKTKSEKHRQNIQHSGRPCQSIVAQTQLSFLAASQSKKEKGCLDRDSRSSTRGLAATTRPTTVSANDIIVRSAPTPNSASRVRSAVTESSPHRDHVKDVDVIVRPQSLYSRTSSSSPVSTPGHNDDIPLSPHSHQSHDRHQSQPVSSSWEVLPDLRAFMPKRSRVSRIGPSLTQAVVSAATAPQMNSMNSPNQSGQIQQML